MTDPLREQLTALIAEWRELARLAKPLESAKLTAEKRNRTKEWMFYMNRASEVEAALRAVPAGGTQDGQLRALAELWWEHDTDTDAMATLFAEQPIEWLVKFGREVLTHCAARAAAPEAKG